MNTTTATAKRARTISLGMVAEELEEYEEARSKYLKALEIWTEFNDEYSISSFSISSLARLSRTTEDDSLLADVAQVLGSTIEEVAQRFESLSSDSSD